jgi:hypothetical protein
MRKTDVSKSIQNAHSYHLTNGNMHLFTLRLRWERHPQMEQGAMRFLRAIIYLKERKGMLFATTSMEEV